MPCYYGEIPCEDTHQMVKADGDYLIRFSGNKQCYVATTKWEGVIKHFAIQKKEEVQITVHTILLLHSTVIVEHLSLAAVMLS